MSISSGKYGYVGIGVLDASTVFNWVLNESTEEAIVVTARTAGGTTRQEGVYDHQGTFEGFGGVPPKMPGEYFDFVGYTGPTTGAFSTAGVVKKTTKSIVEEVTINWDWSSGEVLNWSLSFASGEPIAVEEGVDSRTDISVIDTPIVCGTKVTLGDLTPTTWPNLLSVQLSITAKNPSYFNSKAAIRARHPGIIDWTCEIIEQSRGEFQFLETGSILSKVQGGSNFLRIFVDATDSWELFKAILLSTTDLTVNINTGEIIQQTHNFAMDGKIDQDYTIGRIARPGEDGTPSKEFWWPTLTSLQVIPF